MKRQIVIGILVLATALTLIGCGKETQKAEKETTDIMAEGNHDAEEKDNNINDDLNDAESSTKGSIDTLEGAYKLEGADHITYIFDENKMTIVETGSYKISKGKIKLTYGENKETEYDVTETEAGFNLIHKSTLIPLVYMEGTDGLTGDTEFDGIYSMSDVGYVFAKDGSLKVVTVHNDLKVKKNKVSFADQNYEWRSDDGKIIISSNETDVMTLIP